MLTAAPVRLAPLAPAGLEYTKGESQTNIEVTKESDFSRLLEIEEEYIKNACDHIIAVKPDVVITEKGVSDLAQHYLVKHNITAIRRVRKSDNNRIARAVGAQIVNRFDEVKESDIGLGCGLFEVRKLGDEYFTFMEDCADPKACTILLRGTFHSRSPTANHANDTDLFAPCAPSMSAPCVLSCTPPSRTLRRRVHCSVGPSALASSLQARRRTS